jgi:hypothetical protein
MTIFNLTANADHSGTTPTVIPQLPSGFREPFINRDNETDIYDTINITIPANFDWTPTYVPPQISGGYSYPGYFKPEPTFYILRDHLGHPYYGQEGDVDSDGLFTDRLNFILPAGWSTSLIPDTAHSDPNWFGTNGGFVRLVIKDENGVVRDPGTFLFWQGNVNITIACFTKGADVLCAEGVARKIETLQAGDLVMTMDHGLLPIRWIGSSKVSAETLAQFPHLRPVRIAANTFGRNRDTLVSPQHRILVSSPKLDLMFGETEALAPAKALVNGHSVTVAHDVGDVEYFHILMDDHEILNVDDMWSESFHPGAHTMAGLAEDTRQEVIALFPQIEDHADDFMTAARLSLKPKEVVVLGL